MWLSLLPGGAQPSPRNASSRRALQGCSGEARCEIDFESHDGRVHANGQPFSIKGVNWFGSESHPGAPGGLHINSVDWYLEFLSQNGFNALRLPFNHQSMLHNDPILLTGTNKARELRGLTYSEMFLAIAQKAAKYGILVMMTCHRTTPTAWPGEGLWHDSHISEQQALDSWSSVADALCGQWNVFAADLQNEPHKASWGKGRDTDWDKAAARIGNHVLSRCPRWLIMVEGVGYNPGAPGADNPAQGFWWGENLVGIKVAPVALSNQRRLVYSPHSYGPSVYMHNYFKAPDFPNNMESVWESHFGFAQQYTGQAIVIGETGGFYTGKDREWQDWAIRHAARRGFGVFYFELNPDSEDTGGLLANDWTAPLAGKLALLTALPSTSVETIVDTACLCSTAPPPSPAPPPLPFAALRCYAERYDDLLSGYCNDDPDDCQWQELYHHFMISGEKEGRKMDCKPPSAPPWPQPPPPRPPPRPPPKPPPPPARTDSPPYPPGPPPLQFKRPPPAPPFDLSAALAALHGTPGTTAPSATATQPRTAADGGAIQGRPGAAGPKTVSVVAHEIAQVAATKLKQRVDNDIVAFGFAVAIVCLGIVCAFSLLCRLARCFCAPRYAGVDLHEVVALDARRRGATRVSASDLAKVKPRRRRREQRRPIEPEEEHDEDDEDDEDEDEEGDEAPMVGRSRSRRKRRSGGRGGGGRDGERDGERGGRRAASLLSRPRSPTHSHGPRDSDMGDEEEQSPRGGDRTHALTQWQPPSRAAVEGGGGGGGRRAASSRPTC